MTYRDIVTGCPSEELFALVWRCWGWGMIIFVGAILLIVGIASDPSVTSVFLLIMFLFLIYPIIAFAQGIVVAAIVVAGKSVYRNFFR